jgi:hypothetical protein
MALSFSTVLSSWVAHVGVATFNDRRSSGGCSEAKSGGYGGIWQVTAIARLCPNSRKSGLPAHGSCALFYRACRVRNGRRLSPDRRGVSSTRRRPPRSALEGRPGSGCRWASSCPPGCRDAGTYVRGTRSRSSAAYRSASSRSAEPVSTTRTDQQVKPAAGPCRWSRVRSTPSLPVVAKVLWWSA